MAYNLSVTEHSEELLDNILHYLIYQFQNEQAAKHLLDEIELYMTALKKILCNFLLAGICIWQKEVTARLLRGRWIMLLYLELKRML